MTTTTTTSNITSQNLEDYMAGKAELKDLIEVEASYLEQLRGRAQFFIDGGHLERALIMLEMLEELDRTDPTPTLCAIDVLLKLGESDAAEEKIERWLAREPDNPDALVAKAELLISSGEMVPAAKLLAAVLDRDPQGSSDWAKRARSVAARAHALYENA